MPEALARRVRGAIGCEGAGGCVIASHVRQENFSRTCWITFSLPWDQLQRLGDVLAELVQNPAAARAGRCRWIDDTLKRQMLGQRPA